MTSLFPFQLLTPLGQGGMGSVFRGCHCDDGVAVAIKILTGRHIKDTQFQAAFADEVRAVASLDHPGIIGVYDHGHLSAEDIEGHTQELSVGSPFLVMELAQEGTLEADLSLTWVDFRSILLQLLDALAHAHSRGLIHRDIKPANVLRFSSPNLFSVKLADFGISHAMGRIAPESGELDVSGTPQYMAPEQFTTDTHTFGPWTDLYALGCLAYHLLTGRAPFDNPNIIGLYNSHCHAPRPSIDAVEAVPAGLEQWIHRLMNPDRTRRFQHAADASWALLNLSPPQRPGVLIRRPRPDEPSSPMRTWPITGMATSIEDTIGTDTPLVAHDLIEPVTETNTEPTWQPPMAATWRDAESPQPLSLLHGAGVGLFGLRPVPMVGRIEERDTLWNLLRQCVQNEQPSIAIIHGPAGCGKSRLASWLAHRASEVGAANYAIAYHSEIPGPVEPIISMLRRLYRVPGQSSSKIADQFRTALPHWSDTDRNLLAQLLCGETDEALPGRDRQRIFAQALREQSAHRPLIVWIDDAQWGTSALALAEQITRARFQPSPLLFVLAIRDEALATSPVEAEKIRQLQQISSTQTIEIGALSPQEHLELISTLLGFDQELTRRLARRTEGNPLFAVELVGDWISKGLLEATSQGFALANVDDTPLLPDDLFHLWNDRVDHVLEGFDPTTGNIALEMASILGQSVRIDEWERACAKGAPTTDTSLNLLMERLLDRRLVTRTEQGFSFAHGMFRETLHRRSQEAKRWTTLHSACASMLNELYSPKMPGRAERLAFHFREADQFRLAFTNARRAAQEQIARSEFTRALELLDDAASSLDILDIDDGIERDHLELTHLDILQQRLDLDSIQQRANILLQRAILNERPEIKARAREFIARCHRRKHHHESTANFTAALQYFDQANNTLGLARCLEGLAWNYVKSGDLDVAEEHYRHVLQLLPEPTSRAIKLVCDTLNGLAEIARRQSDYPRALTWLNKGQKLASSTGNTRVLADFENSRGELYRETGAFDNAEIAYRKTLEIFEVFGGVNSTVGPINLALVYLGREEFQRTYDEMTSHQKRLDIERHHNYIVILEAMIAAACAGLGHQKDALLHFQESVDLQDGVWQFDPDLAFVYEILATEAAEHSYLDLTTHAWRQAAHIWRGLDNSARLTLAEDALANRSPSKRSSS